MNKKTNNVNSRKEDYEKLKLEITAFDSEDVITTSGILPQMIPDEYEQFI